MNTAKIKTRIIISLLAILTVISIGLILPAPQVIPVADATRYDWNHKTFWNPRWGKSWTHKGIDIFAPVNKSVLSSTYGIVLWTTQRKLGGNVVLVLGPKWQVHYYAHLRKIKAHAGQLVRQGTIIGTVGRTGNAIRRPSHLHYSILSLVPYPWRWDSHSPQGWKKVFFLNPTRQLLPKHAYSRRQADTKQEASPEQHANLSLK